MLIKLDSCLLFWQHIAHHWTSWEILVKLSFIDYLLTESQLWHLKLPSVLIYDFFFPTLFSFDNHMEFTMARPDDVEYISIVLFHSVLIHNKLQYVHWRTDRLHLWRTCVLHHASKRPDSLCTWPSMSVDVSAIHCQFCKSEPLLFFWDTD